MRMYHTSLNVPYGAKIYTHKERLAWYDLFLLVSTQQTVH